MSHLLTPQSVADGNADDIVEELDAEDEAELSSTEPKKSSLPFGKEGPSNYVESRSSTLSIDEMTSFILKGFLR